MKCSHIALAIALSTTLAAAANAGTREQLIDRYGTEARAADAAFGGFSATRGETLHRGRHSGGKPDTPSCTTCHADNPRNAGETRTGKRIEPMAVSITATRYTDPAKVEKWFRRNCTEVLGRECSAREKGDWLTYMMGL